MNDPTNRAMTANTIRNMLKKLMSSLIVGLLLRGVSAPVSTSVPCRARPARCARRAASSLDTVGGDDLDRVDLARARSGSAWAARRGEHANDGAAGAVGVAEGGDADDRDGCGPAWVSTVTESPTAKLAGLGAALVDDDLVVGLRGRARRRDRRG